MKTMFFSLACALHLFGLNGSAVAQDIGLLDSIRGELADVQAKLSELQNQIDSMPTPERGPRGEQGPRGEAGPEGPAGRSGETSLPANMVVAFDGRCPAGWREHESSRGLFIVGVGDGFLLGQKGGALNHRLTPAELPDYMLKGEAGDTSHTHPMHVQFTVHNTESSGSPNPAAGPQTGRYTKQFPADGKAIGVHESEHSHPVQVASGGQNEPHNNMPPYISLHFCTPDL